MANLLVAGVEDQIRRLAQRAVPPGRQFLVEQGRGAAHLDAADVQPAQFLGDGGDLARGDALDVHLGHGQLEGPFAPLAPLQDGGVKLDAARLRDLKLKLPEPAGDRLGLKAVGVAATLAGALVGSGSQGFAALELHGFVQQNLHGLRHASEAVVGEQLDDRVEFGRLRLAGHACFLSLLRAQRIGNRLGPSLSSRSPREAIASATVAASLRSSDRLAWLLQNK